MKSSGLSREAREDARLVRECRAGSERAFEALIGRHQDQVFNVACRMVGDREEALDLAQETFIKAFQGLGDFKEEMPFRAWLMRICTNSAIDLLRRRGRRREFAVDMRPSSGGPAAPGALAPALEPRAPAREIPENVSLSNETAEAVYGGLETLPDKYRAVLVLHHMEQMSYSEIGKVLGVPRNTAKTWGYRARGLLCQALEGVM